MVKPLRVGLLLLAVAAACAALLAAYLAHGVSARDRPLAIEAFVARRLRHLAIPRGARRRPNPIAQTEEGLAQARAHFADHCAQCHGNDGRGQTEIGQNLYPKAPNMQSADTQSLSDGELFYIIKNGVRLTGMPAWGKDTPEEDHESWQLVAFIRHLPQITPKELEEMKALNPVSPEERKEAEEEKEFLEGSGEPASVSHEHATRE